MAASSGLVGADGVPAELGLVNAWIGAEPAADRRRMRSLHTGVQAADRVPDRLGADTVRPGLRDDLVHQLPPRVTVLALRTGRGRGLGRGLPGDAAGREDVAELGVKVVVPAACGVHRLVQL